MARVDRPAREGTPRQLTLAPLTRWLLACGVPAGELDLEVVRDAIWMALLAVESSPKAHAEPEQQPELTSLGPTFMDRGDDAGAGSAPVAETQPNLSLAVRSDDARSREPT